MWVRGLKRQRSVSLGERNGVASYVGAWIETCYGRFGVLHALVASYVGAWIETRSWLIIVLLMMSHPMWVRGLKQTKC